MAEIHLKNLAHSYYPNPVDENDYALKQIDHVWEDGKAYALLGASGCGKSTLLNMNCRPSALMKRSEFMISSNHVNPAQKN